MRHVALLYLWPKCHHFTLTGAVPGLDLYHVLAWCLRHRLHPDDARLIASGHRQWITVQQPLFPTTAGRWNAEIRTFSRASVPLEWQLNYGTVLSGIPLRFWIWSHLLQIYKCPQFSIALYSFRSPLNKSKLSEDYISKQHQTTMYASPTVGSDANRAPAFPLMSWRHGYHRTVTPTTCRIGEPLPFVATWTNHLQLPEKSKRKNNILWGQHPFFDVGSEFHRNLELAISSVQLGCPFHSTSLWALLY